MYKDKKDNNLSLNARFIISKLYFSLIKTILIRENIQKREPALNFAERQTSHCVVPENIHTPTTEGISHWTPHPPGFSLFEVFF